jgi:hypothetical protein
MGITILGPYPIKMRGIEPAEGKGVVLYLFKAGNKVLHKKIHERWSFLLDLFLPLSK